MAEPLKNHYGAHIPHTIAEMISATFPGFNSTGFIKEALNGYEALELLPRAWHIAHTLRRHLPDSYPRSAEILMASLGPRLVSTEEFGMAPFLYLPHVFFVAEYGLEHFEISMQAQYELTQRFTAEFSIRPYLEQHPQATLAQLKKWADDPSPHVRRLVSEGTRPRLPWAPRLRAFQRDPAPVLALLELLKDDPVLYVRRSVANNLNDIGKDHPDLLVKTAQRWLHNASEERRWVVKHALRSAIKRAEPGALGVLGYGDSANLSVKNGQVTPSRVHMGQAVEIAFDVANTGATPQRVLVDFRIHFIKANGKASPKVFKLKTLELAPQQSVPLSKTVSLATMTTRRHYPGPHKVEVILNGTAIALGEFELLGS